MGSNSQEVHQWQVSWVRILDCQRSLQQVAKNLQTRKIRLAEFVLTNILTCLKILDPPYTTSQVVSMVTSFSWNSIDWSAIYRYFSRWPAHISNNRWFWGRTYGNLNVGTLRIFGFISNIKLGFKKQHLFIALQIISSHASRPKI